MKKMIKTAALTGALAAIAVSAQAAPLDINIYGASAQFAFLSAIADNLLKSPAIGCASTTLATQHGTYYAVQGVAGTGICANGINLRVANKSSGDGIKAVLLSAGAAPCTALGNNYRQFMEPGAAAAPASTDASACKPVTMAASDVAFNTFNENTNGCQYGPQFTANSAYAGALSCGPGAGTKSCTNNTPNTTNYCYTAKSQAPFSDPTGALAVVNPMVVPFAFWVNNTVQISRCAAGDPHAGQICDHTGGTGLPCATAAACVAQPIDDISRIQAANIFSGTIQDLTLLDNAYSSTSANAGSKIRVCLRTAGSGTLSTLNQAVMNAGQWGAPLATQNPATPNCKPGNASFPACLPTTAAKTLNKPWIYFNDSTDDLLYCVHSVDNAFGVADADACNSAAANQSSYFNGTNAYGINLCSGIHQTTYNGYPALRTYVSNGLYEFWTQENLYLNTTTYASGTPENNFFGALSTAIDPSFLTAAVGGDSAHIWATVPEMYYSKTDTTYPASNGGAATPTWNIYQ